MKKSAKFSPEVRERAVRLVFEQRGQHESQWAAVVSIAGKIGCTPQTLLNWVRQHERDTGQRDGATTAEMQRVKDLEREVREVRVQAPCGGGRGQSDRRRGQPLVQVAARVGGSRLGGAMPARKA